MTAFEYPEGATPIDPEETDGLKLAHVTTRAELDRWEQENIQAAIGWTERMRKTDVLTEEFVRTLHKKMFGKVWRWAGTFRRTNKNIGVDWIAVPVEIRMLLEDVRYWTDHGTFPPDEIAYRFHHRLVWVHPFPNGNGRHARLMADLLLERKFGQRPFTWGGKNMAGADRLRERYISALRSADRNDYAELSAFVRS